MTRRQPTYSEAQREVQTAENMWNVAREKYIMHDGKRFHEVCGRTAYYGRDGLLVRLKHHRYWWFQEYPASDVTRLCHDCSRILVDRWDSPGYQQPKTVEPKYYISPHCRSRMEYVDLCIGCFGGRAHRYAIAKDWADNRRTILKLERTTKQCQ